DDAREFIRLEQSTGAWPIAADLIAALDGFGAALVAGDLEAARGWLDASLVPGPDLEGRLRSARGGRHRVVAFARVGAQRLVKLRIDRDAMDLTLLLRCVPTEAGWRIAALEPVTASAAQLA
ncbi:MAG TPA: hypothetical protein VMC04_08170, partial [Verrucomicrobiae bacterium]|nr:hypothetical protein [Verrucomicrobiae bacterium]